MAFSTLGAAPAAICYDDRTRQRVKTAELIVEKTDWQAEDTHPGGQSVVAVRVGWQKSELQQKVKAAGGKWDPANDEDAEARQVSGDNWHTR